DTTALCFCLILFFFFFSSRRRHTRFSRDWSSDVCSSDLPHAGPPPRQGHPHHQGAPTVGPLPRRAAPTAGPPPSPGRPHGGTARSEERRVGKERRGRRTLNTLKHNNTCTL